MPDNYDDVVFDYNDVQDVFDVPDVPPDTATVVDDTDDTGGAGAYVTYGINQGITGYFFVTGYSEAQSHAGDFI